MPRRTVAQVEADLIAAQQRRVADLDLIHRALIDVTQMDYLIDELLEQRRELTQPGRHRATA